MGFFIFIIWIILSLLVGAAGSEKTTGFGGAFLLSLLFSPIVGILFVAAALPKPKPPVTYTCKFCGFKSEINSHFCPACDKDISGKKKEEYTQK